MINQFVLIIGAMKCGTTSLFSYLAQHPQICPAKTKEPRFFTTDKQWAQGINHYFDLWDWNPNVHRIALEASTSYTRIPTYQNAPVRIQKLAIETQSKFKFIYIVRDPIDRIQSHFTYSNALGHPEAVVDIASGVHSDLLTTSMYTKQLSYYRELFPAEDILVINFTELKHSPHILLKKICTFLAIDEGFRFQNTSKVMNKNRGRIKRDKLWATLRKVNALAPIAKQLPIEHKQWLHGLYAKKVEKNTSLSNELQDFILAMLSDDLHRLKQDYDIDFLSNHYKETANYT